MLKFDVKVPEYDIQIVNERATVEAMADAVKAQLVRRLAFGMGARGALPRPKSGGQPYSQTGTLAKSIGVVVSNRPARPKKGQAPVLVADRWRAVVRALGDRPANENVDRKVKAARDAQTQRRATLAVALSLSLLGGNTVDPMYLRKRATKSGDVFRVSSVRVRTADTNAALAGILSVPPKDPDAKKGGRGVYRVFEATDEYRAIAYRVAAGMIKARVEGVERGSYLRRLSRAA